MVLPMAEIAHSSRKKTLSLYHSLTQRIPHHVLKSNVRTVTSIREQSSSTSSHTSPPRYTTIHHHQSAPIPRSDLLPLVHTARLTSSASSLLWRLHNHGTHNTQCRLPTDCSLFWDDARMNNTTLFIRTDRTEKTKLTAS